MSLRIQFGLILFRQRCLICASYVRQINLCITIGLILLKQRSLRFH